MQAYQERVIIERDELSEKINKLRTFVDDPKNPLSGSFAGLDELDRLRRQWVVMRAYLAILNERIAAFQE